MNQHFRLKYDELRENNPASQSQDQVAPDEGEAYASYSNVRNVCFALPDGYRLFLNYGYLVAGEYSPANNEIVLSFTSHLITLRGIHLEGLFYEFMQQKPRQIVCEDARYNVAAERQDAIVNTIHVKALGE